MLRDVPLEELDTAGRGTSEHPSEDRGSFCIVGLGTTLHRALTFVGTGGGWVERVNPSEQTFIVSSSAHAVRAGERIGRRRILVIQPTAYAASIAVSAVANGLVMAVFRADQPDDFITALEALEQDRVMMPGSVLELSTTMPDLSERQRLIIAGLMRNRSNREIGMMLKLSPTSVKRELTDLFRTCGVISRGELVLTGLRLGIDPVAYLSASDELSPASATSRSNS